MNPFFPGNKKWCPRKVKFLLFSGRQGSGRGKENGAWIEASWKAFEPKWALQRGKKWTHIYLAAWGKDRTGWTRPPTTGAWSSKRWTPWRSARWTIGKVLKPLMVSEEKKMRLTHILIPFQIHFNQIWGKSENLKNDNISFFWEKWTSWRSGRWTIGKDLKPLRVSEEKKVRWK